MVRVTEVLNYFKEPWYIDWVHRVGRTEANKISKASMKIGSRVDEIIKEKLAYVPYMADYKKESKEVHNCLEAFNKWWRIYKPKSITPCSRLYATIEGQEVTGEPDIMVDDVLVDIKCSSKISLSYWVQVCIYWFMKHEVWKKGLPSEASRKVGILRLDKVTASYEYVVQDYDPNKVSVWCGLMRAYCYFKGDDDGGLDIQEVGENKEVA